MPYLLEHSKGNLVKFSSEEIFCGQMDPPYNLFDTSIIALTNN